MFLLAKLLQDRANSFTLVFYRSLVQSVVSVWEVIRKHEDPLGPPDTRCWLLLRGGTGAVAVIAFFYAIQHLPLPDAVTLQFTTPPFAAAFAVCLAGEKWMLMDMIGAVVCLVGVILISHPTWLFGVQDGKIVDDDGATDMLQEQEQSMKALAILVALIGAAIAGMAYMSVRLIGEQASANVMVLYYACMSIPMAFVGSKIFLGEWNVWGDGMFSSWDYFMLLLTGLFGYGGQYFTNLGLQRETAASVSFYTRHLCVISASQRLISVLSR
jgi:drug/metabolite transporter (DMT)-like permease